jgi:hypothetical protein
MKGHKTYIMHSTTGNKERKWTDLKTNQWFLDHTMFLTNKNLSLYGTKILFKLGQSHYLIHHALYFIMWLFNKYVNGFSITQR